MWAGAIYFGSLGLAGLAALFVPGGPKTINTFINQAFKSGAYTTYNGTDNGTLHYWRNGSLINNTLQISALGINIVGIPVTFFAILAVVGWGLHIVFKPLLVCLAAKCTRKGYNLLEDQYTDFTNFGPRREKSNGIPGSYQSSYDIEMEEDGKMEKMISGLNIQTNPSTHKKCDPRGCLYPWTAMKSGMTLATLTTLFTGPLFLTAVTIFITKLMDDSLSPTLKAFKGSSANLYLAIFSSLGLGWAVSQVATASTLFCYLKTQAVFKSQSKRRAEKAEKEEKANFRI